MITEAVLTAFFQFIGFFIGKFVDVIGAPPNGYFSIPSPLFPILYDISSAITVVFPVLVAWWVWRQIKA